MDPCAFCRSLGLTDCDCEFEEPTDSLDSKNDDDGSEVATEAASQDADEVASQDTIEDVSEAAEGLPATSVGHRERAHVSYEERSGWSSFARDGGQFGSLDGGGGDD